MKKMKQLLTIAALLLGYCLHAQVAINTDGTSANSSAMLEVKATDKGFLPPRVSLTSITDVSTISSPATGLLVYNTNASITNGFGVGFYFYNGSRWLVYSTGHYIGETYGGGKVFWVDVTGQHGLIAETSDQHPGIQWRNGTYRVTNATGDYIGAGEPNTQLIIAMQTNDNTGANFAALVCANWDNTAVSGEIYGDWYLPSKYELNLLYEQRSIVLGFSTDYYWSSTEASSTNAWDQDFDPASGGLQASMGKEYTDRVRCIRKF